VSQLAVIHEAWTCRELIEYLRGCDPDAVEVLSSDAEGNNYSPLRTVDQVRYLATTSYSGELTDAVQHVPAVSLWPIN
jgi:hypothetical protein